VSLLLHLAVLVLGGLARIAPPGAKRTSQVVVEIVETEPVVKGQTASSSYKPAICSNGLRVMVPPHIGAGTKVVISTEDHAYVERAKG
jgi:elongation factor P